MPKVLVVEDQYGYFEQIKSGLDGKAEVLHAATLQGNVYSADSFDAVQGALVKVCKNDIKGVSPAFQLFCGFLCFSAAPR